MIKTIGATLTGILFAVIVVVAQALTKKLETIHV